MEANRQIEKAKGMPVIDVGIDDSGLTDEEAVEILRESSGLAKLPKSAIRGMAQLGLYARGIGVLRKQRGEVLVTQAWLNDTLQIMTRRLAEEDARGAKAKQSVIRGYAHGIAELVGVKTASQHLALDLEKVAAPTGKPDDVERPRNVGFGTGTVIVAVQEVKKELPPNGNGG